MIWTAERNMDQGALVASMYEQAASVPCERKAIMVGGLRGADTAGALTQAGIDAIALSVHQHRCASSWRWPAAGSSRTSMG